MQVLLDVQPRLFKNNLRELLLDFPTSASADSYCMCSTATVPEEGEL